MTASPCVDRWRGRPLSAAAQSDAVRCTCFVVPFDRLTKMVLQIRSTALAAAIAAIVAMAHAGTILTSKATEG